MIELFIENELYGIKDNGIIVVPSEHFTKESAIGEFEYFERLNTNDSQFLKHKLTNEEIDKIVEKLSK